MYFTFTVKAEGETEVLVAGDPERLHMSKCDSDNGITYHPNVINIMVGNMALTHGSML